MTSCMGCLVRCVFVVSALLHGVAARTTHNVGGSIGWTVPPSGFSYDTWAASQTFMVGDYLLFNDTSNTSDCLYEVFSKADYDSCNMTTSFSSFNCLRPGSSISSQINTAGEQYYFSTNGCETNQKLTFNVSASPTSSTSFNSSFSSSSSSSSFSNSSSSLTVGDFSLLLLSTVIAFFY